MLQRALAQPACQAARNSRLIWWDVKAERSRHARRACATVGNAVNHSAAWALCSARGGYQMTDRRIRIASEFACPCCDSPSVAFPDEGEDRVVCAGCGAFIATRSQFRRLIERREGHPKIPTSGGWALPRFGAPFRFAVGWDKRTATGAYHRFVVAQHPWIHESWASTHRASDLGKPVGRVGPKVAVAGQASQRGTPHPGAPHPQGGAAKANRHGHRTRRPRRYAHHGPFC